MPKVNNGRSEEPIKEDASKLNTILIQYETSGQEDS